MAMAQKDYVHKTVTLKCCIASSDIKKDTSHIRLISSKDWEKNLTLILSKIAKKFKFIANMDDLKWILTINDKVIDKTNAVKFGELLSSVPPIAIIKIEEQKFIIIIHCNDKTFEYKLKANLNEWTNNNYVDLIASIRKQFNINSDFDLYEDLKGDNDDIVDIDDMDDIKHAITATGLDTDTDGENDDNKEAPGFLPSRKPLHLYVKVYNTNVAYHAYADMNDFEGDIKANEFKDIINELKTEMYAIKQQLSNVKQAQKQCAHSDNDANKNQDNKQQQTFIGQCNKCNENIKYSENELFNFKLINNKWQHIDCGYSPKGLSLINKIDVWSPIKYSLIQLNQRKASIDIASPAGWHNIFGLNTIKRGDGIIKWTIKINKLANNNFYIGIINSTKVRQSLSGNAYTNGIALSANGYIYCFKEYYGTPFKCNRDDIVCIILDIQNNILLFKVNDIAINVPVNDLNVDLKSMSWKLFASLYNPSDEIMILDNDNPYDDHKDESKENELSALRCSNCNKPVTKRDNDIFNIQWSNKAQWQHDDCGLSVYQIPKLDALSAKDKFNKLTAYKASVTLNNAADGFTTNKQNVHQTVFGVITIAKGIKEWNIRIDNGSANMYIGIIETGKQSLVAPNTVPNANQGVYHISCNGQISGNGVNLQSNLSYTKNDILSVVLDLDNNTLGFGKKNKFVLANGAQLKNKAYNLFVSMYAKDNGVSIVDNRNEEQKSNIGDRGKILYNCGSCNKGVYELDFEINNTKYDANGWVHVDCSFRIANLSPNARDEWDRRTSHNGRFIINRYDATLTGSGGYPNVFGIITISRNTKQWNVKVDKVQSNMYIGIIDSTKLQGKKTGKPSDSYFLTQGGCIQGSGLSINTSFRFKTGDVVNVILDMEKGVLSFGINNANFSYAKGAIIKGRSFNLFCSILYANTKVTIQP